MKMVYLYFRRLKQQTISLIVWRYCFCFFIFLFFACNTNKKKYNDTIKLAKTVPSKYLKKKDILFTKCGDTIYYNHQFFTGFIYELNIDLDTILLQSFFNGVEEGWQRQWYSKNKLKEERFYINGKKEGINQGWWQNGKPQFYFVADNNSYNGIFRQWNNTGLLITEFNFINGVEDGPQKMWWDNGTVRANFVTKNNRRYGLIGLKTCSNPYDSIRKK
jgi:antitoxin component YwqK of YwqJK toxin-antitoxin module